MSNLLFKRIRICSESEQGAVEYDFHPRKTLLWGDNGGGKSAVIKSLFRAFDAEPHGEIDFWDYSAIVAVDFSISGRVLTVVRREDLRALFEGHTLLGVATSSLQWNKVFAGAVGFGLHLVDRAGRFRQAAPSNYFLPFFINQDGSFESGWSTFDGLSQFQYSAQHTIEYFTGVRPALYFKLKAQEQGVKAKEAELRVDLSTLQRTRARVKRNFKTIPVKLSEKEFHVEIRELSVKLAHLGTNQDGLRKKILDDQELLASLEEQIRLSEAALKEHKADFKVAASAGELGGKFVCPTCQAEHHESFHSYLSLAEDARELNLLKERLEGLVKSTKVRLEQRRQKMALLKQDYVGIQGILNAKRGKFTFNDFLKSRSSAAADEQLSAEEVVVCKEIDVQSKLLDDIKLELRTVAKMHDSEAPANEFREHFAKSYVQLNVPAVKGLEKWPVHRRQSKSGSRHARSIIAYYAALWRTIEKDGVFPVPLVIDSPNQGAQDKKNLQKLLTEIAANAPNQAQVILAHEENNQEFGANRVHAFSPDTRILTADGFELLAPEMFFYVETARKALASIGVSEQADEDEDDSQTS